MQRKGIPLLALAAAALTISVLWYLNRPIIVKEATWEDVKAEAQSGGYRLITTEELAQRYRQDAGKSCWWTPGRIGNIAAAISRGRKTFP